MADVAFLLLLFFLTATTIDVDSGIRMTLPPPGEDPPQMADRNMLRVLVSEEAVLIEDERGVIEDVRAAVVRHVSQAGLGPEFAERPERAIVSLKAARSVPYATYLSVLDAIKLGYRDLHDAEARGAFGAADYASYRQRLGSGQADRVLARYPVRISLAEPPERTK